MEIKHIKEVNYNKLTREVKLVVSSQNAKLGPPVGPVLGQVKIKVKDFCTNFNEITQKYKNGLPLRVVVFVYKNETFDFIIKSPSISFLLRNLLKFKKEKNLSLLDLYKIALIRYYENKEFDLNIIYRNILNISKNIGIKVK